MCSLKFLSGTVKLTAANAKIHGANKGQLVIYGCVWFCRNLNDWVASNGSREGWAGFKGLHQYVPARSGDWQLYETGLLGLLK
jgi:hypothetical protein